jgi:hypothetical protein
LGSYLDTDFFNPVSNERILDQLNSHRQTIFCQTALFTFAFDSFVIESSGVGILEMLGYVFSLMIVTFGLVFIHLSR